MSKTGLAYLESLNEELNSPPLLEKIKDLYSQKLWHNITSKLFGLVKLLNGKQVGKFYSEFLSEFMLKLNPFDLASLVVQMSSKYSDDMKEALDLLNDVSAKISSKSLQASSILAAEVALCQLKMGNIDESKVTLSKLRSSIEEFGLNIDNSVNSAYYKAEALYFKETMATNQFYRSALFYLAYTPIDTIPNEVQVGIAYDLGIAALIGDKIFNFGEFLGHPIVETLKQEKFEWLLRLLYAFNQGSFSDYDTIRKTSLAHFPEILKKNEDLLHEKLELMCLMEFVFTRLAGDRNITFEDISKTTGRPIGEVEFLILRALSLGLVKGSIDETRQLLQVTWVQPRVLDLKQTESIKFKIGKWLEKVNHTLDFLEKEGKLASV